ncbi:MAG TPA: hypothetical protein PJ991_02630 [Kiritimatiellia bacterium]|nr:hypothetical protein [Kiritimatiellia bacterium]
MTDVSEQVNQRSPERTDSSRDAALSRTDRRVRAALDVLRTTIRDIHGEHFHGAPPEGVLDLKLSLRVTPSENWKMDFKPPLPEQLQAQLAERQAMRNAMVMGRVHCFRCDVSTCEHAEPPSPLHVFRGYDATGRPEWQEFAQQLIDDKDDRVDQLFLKPPRIVAKFQFGRELKGRQLAAFGKASLSYSVLAQVTAGYFLRGGGRMAVSLQVVEGRTREGDLTLRLNPVGHALNDALLLEWLTADKSAMLFRAMQIAEQELLNIESTVINARRNGDQDIANRYMGRIPGVARRLAEALERGGRQSERRTRHVEQRRMERRPVHKALEDARGVSPENCYYDEKAKTFVVVGDRGRVHAFNADGRHVTSFMMKAASIQFRVRTGRWRAAVKEEWGEVRRNLHARSPEKETSENT